MFYWILGIVAVFLILVISSTIDKQASKPKKRLVFGKEDEEAIGSAILFCAAIASKLGIRLHTISDDGVDSMFELALHGACSKITPRLADELEKDGEYEPYRDASFASSVLVLFPKEVDKKKRGRPAKRKRGRPRKK